MLCFFCGAESAGQAVQKFSGGQELIEFLFFGTKFGRMRKQAAAGAARGMLDVQHFVIENVLDDKLRNARLIHAAIEKNLVGAGIVAAELAAPAAGAPSDVRAL